VEKGVNAGASSQGWSLMGYECLQLGKEMKKRAFSEIREQLAAWYFGGKHEKNTHGGD